jgi:hypothetical protein
MTDKAVTKADVELIIRKLKPVKEAGWGSITIQVQHSDIVYVDQTIGEQVKMEMKEK